MVPVPFPQVTTGWQRPLWLKSLGRNIVKATGGPPSAPTPAAGPTLFSVTVANGPATVGSAGGQVPIEHDAPASALEPPVLPLESTAPTRPD